MIFTLLMVLHTLLMVLHTLFLVLRTLLMVLHTLFLVLRMVLLDVVFVFLPPLCLPRNGGEVFLDVCGFWLMMELAPKERYIHRQ